MRKSSGIIMAILLLGFGGMMMAANVALKPLQRYARIGTDLTRGLENLALVEKDTKVFVMARAADEKRLAKDGWGMVIEMTPAARVKESPGRLEGLAYRACTEAHNLYRRAKDRPLTWFEVKFQLAEADLRRYLIPVDADGRLGRPTPALPRRYPEP